MHFKPFWKDWSLTHRMVALYCAGVLLTALVYLFYGLARGPASVTNWEVRHAQHTTETEITTFDVGGFEFVVPAQVYFTYAFFQGSPLKPRPGEVQVFLWGFVFCILLLLTVITTLPRFWFYAGMGLFIVLAVSLRLEVLYILSISGRTIPFAILALYVLLCFYLAVMHPRTPVTNRLLLLMVLTLIVALVIARFSGVYYPGFHLAVTAYWAALLLTIVFLLMTAHEIPAAFVFLAERSSGGSRNALHFIAIMALYLTYLFLLYFDETGIMQLNMPGIAVYLLMVFSAMLGLWGFRQREHLYAPIFSFAPSGFMLYAALAINSVFATGLFLSVHNDAALKVIRELILFSHLGYGIIFFTYVLSNFIGMMARNLPAHRVLYKPNRMPYFTFRLAGLIATLAFVFYMDWKDYVYHAMGGYYNNLADLHQQLDKPALAEVFYQQVRSYAFQNNRANYQLAVLEANRYNREQAASLYELANAKRPTPYSLVNAGNLFCSTGTWFEAIRLFRNGLEKINDPHLALNLAYAYARVHKTDSAIYFTERARTHKSSRALAESNFLAMIGQQYLPVKVDSVMTLLQPSDELYANALALAVQRRQHLMNHPEIPAGVTHLTIPMATRLHNYLLANLGRHDTTFLAKVHTLASDTINESYSEALKSALAYAYYYQNNVSRALSLLAEISFVSQHHEGRYQYLMGLWNLEQGAALQALHHFERAAEAQYTEATYYLPLVMAEAGRNEEALSHIQPLLQHPDTAWKIIGHRLNRILTLPADAISDDNERYLFCRYRTALSKPALMESALKKFEDDNYKALALLHISQRYLRAGNLSDAILYARRLTGLRITEESVYEKIRHHELLLLALTGDLSELERKLKDDISFSGSHTFAWWLYQALLAEHRQDHERAEHLFTHLVTHNPYFEEGILEAARYFSQKDDRWKVYNILAEAIHRNRHSYRLLKAYADVAETLGFEEFAQSARERANTIRQRW
jgi:hypothetical protein